jgi:hypothetical protein
MEYKASQALSDAMHAVSKVVNHKPEVVTKDQAIAILESIKILWDEVFPNQIADGQESYFASNLGGLAIEGTVHERLTFIIEEVRGLSEPPYVGQFWGRNLEVLASSFENFKYSSPAGQLLNQYLPALLEVSKRYDECYS